MYQTNTLFPKLHNNIRISGQKLNAYKLSKYIAGYVCHNVPIHVVRQL